jgi:microcystin-dependent protein
MSNNGGVYTWSKTAANNASFDNTVNWAEGQAPSSVNDSARSMMASTAKWRDDISGAIVTTGTSAAYIVNSFQIFDSLADFHGQTIAFTPHVTNAAGGVTTTVDGFANLHLRTSPNTELLAGTLIQGTPYLATYNNTDGALYLHGFYGNPYNMPLAGGMDFWGTTVPNSSFAFPIGQAISRTTYATLFAIMGTTYGAGDGSTTFNLPDKTGRVSAMKEAAATRLTATYFGGNSANMGAVGGGESRTLIAANLPPITSENAVQPITVTGNDATFQRNANIQSNSGAGGARLVGYEPFTGAPVSTGNNAISVTSTGTTSTPIRTVQPTIVCNYIIRII